MAKQPLSIDKISKIVELSKKGVFKPEIARRLGVSESSVYKYQVTFDLI